jgi:hypothetical protein
MIPRCQHAPTYTTQGGGRKTEHKDVGDTVLILGLFSNRNKGHGTSKATNSRDCSFPPPPEQKVQKALPNVIFFTV